MFIFYLPLLSSLKYIRCYLTIHMQYLDRYNYTKMSSDDFKLLLCDHMLKLHHLKEIIKRYEEKQCMFSLLQRLSISNDIITNRRRCGKLHQATVPRRITPKIIPQEYFSV